MPLTDLTAIGRVAMGVLLTLLAMSVLSIGILVERLWIYRRSARESRQLAAKAARLLQQGRLAEALETCQGSMRRAHLTRVLSAGLQEWLYQRQAEPATERDAAALATREALRHAIALCQADFRRGLPALATIGSTAPFVGLFGTTLGIINAFSAMAITGAGGLTAISAGISEALVTTAFGLVVAIPAVWAYNLLLGRLDGFGVEMERSAYQLVDHLVKRG